VQGRLGIALLSMVVCACASSEPTSSIAPAPMYSPPTIEASLARLLLFGDASVPIVGRGLHLQLDARDGRGELLDATGAEISSTNDAVATVTKVTTIPIVSVAGKKANSLGLSVLLSTPGTTTLRATLAGHTASIVLTVEPVPPDSRALVVDSFAVVEYRACATDCPYLVYAPLLKLREPTGGAYVDVIAVEFNVPTMTTGLCTGHAAFAPGASEHVNHIHPYLYSNTMIFIRPDGVPLPSGAATARVIIRDAQGNLGLVEASGPILRSVVNPALPTATSDYDEWSC
jgi:hypothetical protein